MAKATKTASKKSSNKRELIEPNGDKRYIRRDEKGRIKESDDVSRSLSQDVRKTAKNKVTSGHGDEGDQAPKKKAEAKKSIAKKEAAPKKTAAKKATAPKKAAAKKSTAKKIA